MRRMRQRSGLPVCGRHTFGVLASLGLLRRKATCAWMMSVPETNGVAPGTRTLWIARHTVHKSPRIRVDAVAASSRWCRRRTRQCLSR